MSTGMSRADDRPSILSKMAALLWLFHALNILPHLPAIPVTSLNYSSGPSTESKEYRKQEYRE